MPRYQITGIYSAAGSITVELQAGKTWDDVTDVQIRYGTVTLLFKDGEQVADDEVNVELDSIDWKRPDRIIAAEVDENDSQIGESVYDVTEDIGAPLSEDIKARLGRLGYRVHNEGTKHWFTWGVSGMGGYECGSDRYDVRSAWRSALEHFLENASIPLVGDGSIRAASETGEPNA